jgi:mono/diheme cytochrome c family protein
MKKVIYSIVLVATIASLASCGGPKREPGKTYMPDMAYSRAYESYPNLDSAVFTDVESSAGNKIYYDRRPVLGAVKRGQMGVYHGTNDSMGIVGAASYANPLPDTSMVKTDKEESERLYKIYCAICHGEKLDGQGPLVASGKWAGAAANLMDLTKFGQPVYADGRVFHSITYGKNQMGGYASQLNIKQRWMVVNYIRSKQAVAAKAAAAKPAATVDAKGKEVKPTTGKDTVPATAVVKTTK